MPDAHDLGLRHDLPRLLSRRAALVVIAGVVGTVMSGCGTSEQTTDGAIPSEIGGPFPGDGSNGPNVLAESGAVRRDITRSFGDASGTAPGLPTRLELTLTDASNRAPLVGAAAYVWHCTRDGAYSLYEEPVVGENFLRGVQTADADGTVVFETIFPGAYPGRYPHVHLEVYESLTAATDASPKLRTTQIALPKDACDRVYATPGYEASASAFAQVPLERDVSFSDGAATQLAIAVDPAASPLTLRLDVRV